MARVGVAGPICSPVDPTPTSPSYPLTSPDDAMPAYTPPDVRSTAPVQPTESAQFNAAVVRLHTKQLRSARRRAKRAMKHKSWRSDLHTIPEDSILDFEKRLSRLATPAPVVNVNFTPGDEKSDVSGKSDSASDYSCDGHTDDTGSTTTSSGSLDASASPVVTRTEQRRNLLPIDQEWSVDLDPTGEPLSRHHDWTWWNPSTWWMAGQRTYSDLLAFNEPKDGRYAFEDDIKCVRDYAQLLDVTVTMTKAVYCPNFTCAMPQEVETNVVISGVLFQTCCAKFKAGPLPDVDRMNNFITHLESVNCVRGIQELEFSLTGNKVTRNLSNVIRNTVAMARDCIAAGIEIHESVFQESRLGPLTGSGINTVIAQPMSQYLSQLPVNAIRWFLNHPYTQRVASVIVASVLMWTGTRFLFPILGIEIPSLQA